MDLRPFVATIEGQAVAYADLQDSGYIDHFFVSGDAAGQGVGSALTEHIHEVAASRGLPELSALVSLSVSARRCPGIAAVRNHAAACITIHSGAY